MEYRILGRTGVKVSQLGFGTMNFAAGVDEATAQQLFNRCLEKGINLFDTANIYGEDRNGAAERMLGKVMKGHRDDVIIIDKVGNPKWNKPFNDGGLSRLYIRKEVENSLKNLDTDHIDFYMIHHTDPNTPMVETLRVLDDLKQQGKIVYAAASNVAAWEIALALGTSAKEGLGRFELIEPMYNLVKRQAEVEILPLCQDQKLGVVTYSPLAAGLLTGKYRGGTLHGQGRIATSARYSGRYVDEQNFRIADAFCDYAKKHGYEPVALAIAWCMSHPAVTAPLIGAKSVTQLDLAISAIDVAMTQELRDEISALSIDPPSATDRSEEKKNPNIFGH